MQKIRQMPLLLMLVAASMLCVGFLNVIRGRGPLGGGNPDGIFIHASGDSREDSSDYASDDLHGSSSDAPFGETQAGPEHTSDHILENTSGDASQADSDQVPEDAPGDSSDSIADTAPDADADGDSASSDPSANESETSPETYTFSQVTDDYLDDALFIGDSRVEGVKLYSGWDNLTYYAEGGLTVYNIFERKVVEEGNEKITIEEALGRHSFGKIYLEIGINEMGTGTVDSFMKQYEAVVAHLRELQPDAILFLCGIMVVTEARSETDDIFNNPNIRERNERIAALADQKGIFYLDFNEVVMDENGNLNTDYTWDAVHLLGKYDSLWLDYFCSHGIVK